MSGLGLPFPSLSFLGLESFPVPRFPPHSNGSAGHSGGEPSPGWTRQQAREGRDHRPQGAPLGGVSRDLGSGR